MKWKNRRQSSNVIDKRNDTKGQKMAAAGLKLQKAALGNPSLREPTPAKDWRDNRDEIEKIISNPGEIRTSTVSTAKTVDETAPKRIRDPKPKKIDFFKHKVINKSSRKK